MKTDHPFRSALFAAFAVAAAGGAPAGDTDLALRQAIIHYVSFDHSTQADYSVGDGRLVFEPRDDEDATKHYAIRSTGGRYGGAIEFFRQTRNKAYYAGRDIVNYDSAGWQGTVSLWLKISPDDDLLPGYCDPLQIRCEDNRNGFLFLEWTKDETPRLFRYVVRPQYELWNPDALTWAEMPDAQKPMVQVERAPFSNQRWTHVLFTFAKVNQEESAVARLYLDGKLQGTIAGRNLNFAWDESDLEQLKLVLGASYIGQMDDLIVFNRPLQEAEIARLRELEHGAATLFAPRD